jgi:uncharacterized membrane protein YgcG
MSKPLCTSHSSPLTSAPLTSDLGRLMQPTKGAAVLVQPRLFLFCTAVAHSQACRSSPLTVERTMCVCVCVCVYVYVCVGRYPPSWELCARLLLQGAQLDAGEAGQVIGRGGLFGETGRGGGHAGGGAGEGGGGRRGGTCRVDEKADRWYISSRYLVMVRQRESLY